MNNEELKAFFKEEIDEIKVELKEMRMEHKMLHKDFYFFKGRFTTFWSLFVVGITIFGETIKKKLGL